MSISLYRATVPTYLQLLGAVDGLVDKAIAHCQTGAATESDLLGARLAEDMLPLAYQLGAVCHHSHGAIDGLRAEVFSPNRGPLPESFADIKQRLATARQQLEAVTEEELNGFEGKPMRFEYGDFRIDFVAENFLLSFSLPNFFFHATTAYDILRWQGLPIGKRDYMGPLRTL